MKRFAVMVSGGGSNLQALIDARERGDIKAEIAAVISSHPGAYALERATSHGITGITVQRKGKSMEQFDAELLQAVNGVAPDFIVLAGFLSILGRELVRQYNNRIINIHPALIPSFCGKGFYGLKVHEAVLDYGVKLSGVTVHFVDEEADTGAVIMQKAVEVLPEDTPEQLQERVLAVEHELLPRAVALLAEDRIRIEGRKVFITGG